jgi:hypothetical protein
VSLSEVGWACDILEESARAWVGLCSVGWVFETLGEYVRSLVSL